MNLQSCSYRALLAIGGVLLLAALFVPWQSGSFFGVEIEPGLWNVKSTGFGGEETNPYSDYDLDESSTVQLVIARAAILLAIVATGAAAFFAIRRKASHWMYSVAAIGGGLGIIAVTFFEQAARGAFNNADDFFSWTHGSNLALAGSILLLAAGATWFIPATANLKVSL